MRKFSCTHWSVWGVRREEWAFQGWGTKSQGNTSTWTAFYSGFITYSEITLEYKGEGAEMLCDEPRAAGVPFCHWFLLSS